MLLTVLTRAARAITAARFSFACATATAPAGEIRLDSYHLKQLETIGIESDLIRWLARSHTHETGTCAQPARVLLTVLTRAARAITARVGFLAGHVH